LENSGDVRKKPALDVLRQDSNIMELDKHREMRRCYNCRGTGHLIARCSKPRKEKREEVRITEEAIEDFSLDKNVREPNSMLELSQLLFVQCLTKRT